MTNIDAIFAAMRANMRRESTGLAGIGLKLIQDLDMGLRRSLPAPPQAKGGSSTEGVTFRDAKHCLS